ncbi:MAG: prolyl oligopeptidase family serine peptidase [Deltaproteobacteria bacterium]|nr:prolyl oligopeptidase family serine peptidase [Deltaproteobacteria bacterium]
MLGLNPARQAAWAVGKIKELYPGEPVYLLGFSAGAHCAASIGVHWDGRDWLGRDFLAEVRRYLDAQRGENASIDFLHDSQLFRADRLILSYPVITGGTYAHRGSFERLLGPEPGEEALRWFSLETQVTAETPPTFLWQTATDESVPVQNSFLFAQSLMQANVPVELHIYPKGAHGLSLATEAVEEPGKGRLRDNHVAGWFDIMLDWLSYQI